MRRSLLASLLSLAVLGLTPPPTTVGATAPASAWSPAELVRSTGGETGFGDVAISSDGELAAVGLPPASRSGLTGSVKVFRHGAAGWALAGTVTPPEGAAASDFGARVEIEQGLLAVGAPNYSTDVEHILAGAVWTWSLADDGTPTYEGRLLADAQRRGETLGWSLDISPDGRRLAVGAPSEIYSNMLLNFFSGITVGDYLGRVYLFDRAASGWTLARTLQPAPVAPGSDFGFSVSFDEIGETLLVGSPYGGGTPAEGAPYTLGTGLVSIYDPATGTERARITNPIADSDNQASFGSWVALSGDGETIAVACPNCPAVAERPGAVFIYATDTPTAAPATIAASAAGIKTWFASGLSITADGRQVAFGAPSLERGAVQVYRKGSTGWEPLADRTPTGFAGSYFGSQVAMSADGSRVIAGALNPSLGDDSASVPFAWTLEAALPSLATLKVGGVIPTWFSPTSDFSERKFSWRITRAKLALAPTTPGDTVEVALGYGAPFGPAPRSFRVPAGHTTLYIRVTDAAGLSSTHRVSLIRQTTPLAPTRPVATRTDAGTYTVSWRASVARGAPVTSYRVRYRIKGAATWEEKSAEASATPSLVLSGLETGKTYEVVVNAISIAGPSATSKTRRFTTS